MKDRPKRLSPFKALPHEELEVCTRVARLRRFEGLSQVDMAKKIAISTDQLVAIENRRVGLKWHTGNAICRVLNISQLWLAFGTEPMRPYFVTEGYLGFILDSSLFTAVCAGPLREALECRRQLSMAPSNPNDTFVQERAFRDMLVKAAEGTAMGLSPESRNIFLDLLPGHLVKLAIQLESPTTGPEKNMLTAVAASGKLAAVKSQLKNLLADLNRLTSEPGKKTKLADFLGAPLTSVSRWLSGEREPGGETTLKMLRWVQEQESQQNTLGSAINTTKGKTQVRKSSYEKQTQVRKKQ